MAIHKPRNAAGTSKSVDPWVTKTQLARQHLVTKAQIDVLVKLGYLFTIRIGPRCDRFDREDAEAGIKAFKAGHPPPGQTVFARTPIDWKNCGEPTKDFLSTLVYHGQSKKSGG